jgi:TetR/AcrR family transcriptional regulator, transcriptional repressor for nem operon
VRPDDTQQSETAMRILDVAERLVEVRGFNGFSYADVSGELKITNAALHYHFANKSDLGVALIVRYTSRFDNALAAVDTRTTDAPERLKAYADLYLDVLSGKRMCLCGMMAAELETLPEPMQAAVLEFFTRNQVWLSRVLKDGKAKGSISYLDSANKTARTIIGTFEGAMLLARLFGDVAGFRSATTHLLAGLRPDTPDVNPRKMRVSRN